MANTLPRRATLTLILLMAASSGFAQDPPNEEETSFRISPVLSMGLTGGGDTIARYRIEYLGEQTDADVDAGEIFFFYGGAKLFWPKTRLGRIVQGGLFGGGEVLTEVGNGAAPPIIGDWDGDGQPEIFWFKTWYEVP